MKLISMTDFVLEQDKIETECYNFDSKVVKYAKFLNQELKIEMFVPFDEDGNVLKEPKKEFYKIDSGGYYLYNTEDKAIGYYNKPQFDKDLLKYEQAKEKVLFDGFEIGKFTGSKDNHFDYIGNKKLELILFIKDVGISNWLIDYNKLKAIEDLIKHKLTLTENAIKQLGL